MTDSSIKQASGGLFTEHDMETELFNELKDSICQMKAIEKDERAPHPHARC
jgi:hypothetical protein